MIRYKYYLSIIGIFLFTLQSITAQTEEYDERVFLTGPRIGLGFQKQNLGEAIVPCPSCFGDHHLTLEQRQFVPSLGMFTRIRSGQFTYLQAEVYLATYQWKTNFGDARAFDLQIPLHFGFDYYHWRLYGGVIYNRHLKANTSDSFDYERQDNSWLWQAGIGFDVHRFVLDFEYNKSLRPSSDVINIESDFLSTENTFGSFQVRIGFML